MNNILVVDMDFLRIICGFLVIDSFRIVGIVLCVVLVFVCIFIVFGNLMIIVFFVFNKRLYKKIFFFVINMVFVDLMLGGVILFVYIYLVGGNFYFWLEYVGELWKNEFFFNLYIIVDIVFF